MLVLMRGGLGEVHRGISVLLRQGHPETGA